MFSQSGAFADAGDYEYQTTSGTGEDRKTTAHHWSSAVFRLPAPMPHLVLDAKSNNFAFTKGIASDVVGRMAPVANRYRDDRFRADHSRATSSDAPHPTTDPASLFEASQSRDVGSSEAAARP